MRRSPSCSLSDVQPVKNVRCSASPLLVSASGQPPSIMKGEASTAEDQAPPVVRCVMRIDRPGGFPKNKCPVRVMRCTPPTPRSVGHSSTLTKKFKEQSPGETACTSKETKFIASNPKSPTSVCDDAVEPEEIPKKSEILKCRNGHQSSYSLRALKTVPNYKESSSGGSNQIEHYNYNHSLMCGSNWLGSINQINSAQEESDIGPINKLPDEILCMIFSYLPKLDLLRVCSNVCHRWQTVSKSSALWQSLTFCGQDVPIQIVCGCIRMSPFLKSITLKDRFDVDIILPILHHQCKRLESVNLVRCRPSELHRKTLRAKLLNPFLKKGQLRNLNLKGTDYRSAKFYQKLCSMPSLRKLNVSCSGGATPQILCEIAKHTYLKVLKHKWHSNSDYYGPKSVTIQLPGKIDDWSNAYSLLFQNAGENLTTLEFYAAGINDSALSGLASCKRLKKLAVYNANCFGSQGMTAVGTLQQLQELLIHNAKLTTSNISDAFETGNLSGLKCLHLNDSIAAISNDVLPDSCLKSIAEQCRHLKHLSLTKCPSVSDSGVQAILMHCAELLSLDVNGAIAVSGQSFLLIPTLTPHLKLLVIEENCPEEKNVIIKKLLESFPITIERLSTWKHRTTSYLL